MSTAVQQPQPDPRRERRPDPRRERRPDPRRERRPDPRRGPVRRYLEARGVVGRFDRPHAAVPLRSADGTPLAATYLPGPPDAPTAVVVVHGFAANRRKPAYARLADGLSLRVPVLTVDLRGHGRSGGACTLGDREADDVAAAVRWLRATGHRHVVVVGASMGATAALHAAATVADPDALVSISGPAWFRHDPDTEPLRRLHTVWTRPVARTAVRVVLGVRVAGPAGWRSPPDPVELAARVASPVLVVHGDDDAYFPPADAETLAAAAPRATVWHEPAGFGHAEDGLSPAFVARLAEAVVAVATDRGFPTG